jgi:hypothetical protein
MVETRVGGVVDGTEAMEFENLTPCFSLTSFNNLVSSPKTHHHHHPALLFPSKLLSSLARGGTFVNNNQIY